MYDKLYAPKSPYGCNYFKEILHSFKYMMYYVVTGSV